MTLVWSPVVFGVSQSFGAIIPLMHSESAGDRARRERAAQSLPPVIRDPAAYAAIAEIVTSDQGGTTRSEAA